MPAEPAPEPQPLLPVSESAHEGGEERATGGGGGGEERTAAGGAVNAIKAATLGGGGGGAEPAAEAPAGEGEADAEAEGGGFTVGGGVAKPRSCGAGAFASDTLKSAAGVATGPPGGATEPPGTGAEGEGGAASERKAGGGGGGLFPGHPCLGSDEPPGVHPQLQGRGSAGDATLGPGFYRE